MSKMTETAFMMKKVGDSGFPTTLPRNPMKPYVIYSTRRGRVRVVNTHHTQDQARRELFCLNKIVN